MRRLFVLLAAAGLVGAGCRPDTVQIAFRPKPGATYRYSVHVRAVSVTTLGGTAPRRTVDDFVMQTRQRVVSVGADSTQLEVRLDIPGVGLRTLTATFDRAAQLSGVTSSEGVPSAALGQLSLSEILPGATGAPPRRPLAPGDRWTIDSPAGLLGGGGARLVGTGRLTSLGVVHGHDVATVDSSYRLPVKRNAAEGDIGLRLDGLQTTQVTTVRVLSDGAVQSALSFTRGTYAITVIPPSAGAGAPLTGTLSLQLRTDTKRIG